ncbi:signal peptidase I [Pseudomonas koreensis]|uniref:Signal peptidase I n=1 Tax=Pseudomonas koreensis TaxID=198620 RepID=A0A9X2XI48_9PSED|nr:signal peptidase I [Pseudomonas koreensis]
MKLQKNPLQAFVMSCLVAGWGLVYVGRIKWALRVAAFLYLGGIALGAFGLIASPKGLYAFAGFVILVKLVSGIAAARLARHGNADVAMPGTRFHVLYVLALAIVTLVLLVPLRTPLLGYKNYFIPSGSMSPTLSIGDYVVSDIRPGEIKVGDIVVYVWNGTEAVKRVAGVPGDVVQISDGNLINNGDSLGLFYAPADRVKKDYSLTLAPLKVEPNHVYLLGDNRDVSNDSRFMGQVDLKDIRGRITGIWFSNERSRIGTTFPRIDRDAKDH